MPETRDTGDHLRTLAEEALDAGRELVRAELSLAKLELENEAKKAGLAVMFAATGLVLLHAGVLVLVAALVMALFGKPLVAAAVGLLLLVLAAGAALAAVTAFERRHLERTRASLSRDAAVLRLKHE
jgi:uncharacterized membrane protein YqjE